jgi:predicted phosphodiesterase
VALYLCVNDIHATRRAPSSCTDSYWPDLLNLLYQTVEVAAQREVRAVVWAGDALHHKAPGRTDHGLMQDLIRVIQAYLRLLLIVPGNHDLAHDRLGSIEETQPLGVLYLAGARRLEGWADYARGAVPVYGVPWLQDWSAASVAEALAGYREVIRDWQVLPAAERGVASVRRLVVTHAPIYPPGSEPRYEGAEYTPASWWADAMGNEGYLTYGHIHEPHGVWQHRGVTFCNFGALSRGSLDEYNLHREVGCALWDSVTGGFEFVPLKAKPAEEVFRLRRHEEVVTAQRSLADFQDRLSAVKLSVLSVETVIAHIREGGHPAPVVDLAEELLTAEQGGA